MNTKRIILSFASPKIRACDYLDDLKDAIDHACCNLKLKYNVTLKGPIVIYDTFVVVDATYPENLNFNVGRRLRGISCYLLKKKPELYTKYLVGSRLFKYISV